jgi:hypothetical protein
MKAYDVGMLKESILLSLILEVEKMIELEERDGKS